MKREYAVRLLQDLKYKSSVDGRLRMLPSHVIEAIAPVLVNVAECERRRCLDAISDLSSGNECRITIERLGE